MTYDVLKEQESQYVMPTYGRFSIALDHGEGSQLWDVEGKRYIDLTSGIGVCCLGYNNEKIIGAITEQAHKLMHVSNLFLTEPMIQVAKTLVEQTGMGKVFFSNSGAESNEGMIKLARKYSYDKYGEGRAEIVTLYNSFHGRTVTTLKATGQDKFHQYFFPFTEGFAYAEANDMASVEAAVNEHTCAVMLELIQGEGGVMPLDRDFVQQVAAYCHEHDLLLLVDEVQTGIGRTGSLFCFQQYGILPDVVSMAKGLGGGVPIGAVMASKTCADVLGPGTHATTFGGTPMVCAAANAVLSEVTKPEFLQEVREKGAYFKKQLLAMGSDVIEDVRGLGLMVGIVVDPEKRAGLVAEIMDQGVLVLTAGTNVIRLLPPLSISYEEIDEALAIMKSVFCKG
ncbi:MAG: aspartate aminotransferase family protein [Eubacteriales bacterium]|nr:aspartate aminotransferase family protein [Eubacteriales bacterium]